MDRERRGLHDGREARVEREGRQTHVSDGRRPKRTSRSRARSVGATAIAAPRAQSIGIPNPSKRRRYGRGETVRRVEQERTREYSSRPAVYTAEAKTSPFVGLHLPSLSVVVIIVILIVALIALLAGPARTLYSAWRDSGALMVEYDVLSSQNDELNHEIERLQSREGIEDEARSRGYIYPGEEAVVVDGLDLEQVADPAKVDEAVANYEQNLPWYVPILDTLFGYQAS